MSEVEEIRNIDRRESHFQFLNLTPRTDPTAVRRGFHKCVRPAKQVAFYTR